MKYSEKVLEKLYNLLLLNHEVEKLYNEAFELVKDSNFRSFFKGQALERNEFGEELKKEIGKLGGNQKESLAFGRAFYLKRMNFKNLIKLQAEDQLLSEVCAIKEASINNYNGVLMERNLPLSLCKILIKQRDHIQVKLNVLKREEMFVA
ncbi:DUF2383 domain-containing protein [Siansivirga zeaxanthinifaciens]|uniref:DUF2383 domain-containing protein n=1 Tax=Siansivirga zeaxanthinifaciens CC-SAMT-1 TaxID=1454006 RepID=A0A0C5W0D8_9FLAO|nr:DUF2383 domain-containing protein [Siansivirga zeaxanthinifaciens]AJR04726.1 hypothetical protein AW14_02115 [Siansivirga zeaxanthinifaciens CC-SAMT-1]